MPNYSQNFEQFKTGGRPITTNKVTLASGQGIVAARSALGQNSTTGFYHKWNPAATDGTQRAVALLIADTDTTAAADANVWDSGTFNVDLVVWSGSPTAAQKATAFVGTPIQLKGAE